MLFIYMLFCSDLQHLSTKHNNTYQTSILSHRRIGKHTWRCKNLTSYTPAWYNYCLHSKGCYIRGLTQHPSISEWSISRPINWLPAKKRMQHIIQTTTRKNTHSVQTSARPPSQTLPRTFYAVKYFCRIAKFGEANLSERFSGRWFWPWSLN